ncbi:hypothetical protein JCM8097_005719 [Rhodosporidiobolus ruineniae]
MIHHVFLVFYHPCQIPALPAELILHILELAYSPHAEDDYTGRSHDVLQCCLVSKQWKQLAEPVLWWSVTITSSEQVDQLAQQPAEKRRLARNLGFVLPNKPQKVTAEQIRQALCLFPDVEHVRLIGEYDTTVLDDRCLLLSDFTVLPLLAEYLTRHQFYACFDPAVPYPPRHIQLLDSPIAWPVLDNIFLLPHRLESLFLPLPPPSSLFVDATGDSDNSTRDAFLKRCKDEGVEVRWYRPAKEEWREVGCSEFREYVEERKTREAEERS